MKPDMVKLFRDELWKQAGLDQPISNAGLGGEQ